MKVIAINGSPRRSWNTAKLCQTALDGAAATGAEAPLMLWLFRTTDSKHDKECAFCGLAAHTAPLLAVKLTMDGGGNILFLQPSGDFG